MNSDYLYEGCEVMLYHDDPGDRYYGVVESVDKRTRSVVFRWFGPGLSSAGERFDWGLSSVDTRHDFVIASHAGHEL